MGVTITEGSVTALLAAKGAARPAARHQLLSPEQKQQTSSQGFEQAHNAPSLEEHDWHEVVANSRVIELPSESSRPCQPGWEQRADGAHGDPHLASPTRLAADRVVRHGQVARRPHA